ncbi:STAS domain-containing protein, partial [Actinomycetospora sp.]|uniref:STAS domain-containing protein n=1 Tax=Actinomycetospora sp. TaxID=1872135 RepID=UPI0039C881AA
MAPPARPGPDVVVVAGVLDRDAAKLLVADLERARTGGAERVQVDLSGLERCDPAGLQALSTLCWGEQRRGERWWRRARRGFPVEMRGLGWSPFLGLLAAQPLDEMVSTRALVRALRESSSTPGPNAPGPTSSAPGRDGSGAETGWPSVAGPSRGVGPACRWHREPAMRRFPAPHPPVGGGGGGGGGG